MTRAVVRVMVAGLTAALRTCGPASSRASLLAGVILFTMAASLLGAAKAVAEDRAEPLPDELEGIGITEHLGQTLPLDLEFVDEAGATVRLRDLFDGTRPVILNLVYFSCPMLCTLVLNGVVDGMKGIKWDLGREFVNVTVSIDPTEQPAMAALKKANYLESYGRARTASGWHFLTGQQAAITSLADVVGFRYRFKPETREFIHSAGTFICTPDGRLSRYLYGIEYDSQTLKLALQEAASNKIGTTTDKLILYCFHYDAATGRYAPAAVAIMRIGGGIGAGVLLVVLVFFWSREGRRRRLAGMLSGLAALGLGDRALAEVGPTFWMPIQGSSGARQVDWLFRFILVVSAVFFALIVVLMTSFVLRYRRRAGVAAERTATHSNGLEFAWTIVPLLLALSIFYVGFKDYLDMINAPQNSYQILVTAQKWNWQFTYPNGYVDGALHVPMDTPVQLVLASEDVIHSLYIPAFRLKKDAVPGRYTKAWFRGTVAGEFPLYCAEYCGRQHSDMLSTVVVHPPGDFEKWLAGVSNIADTTPPAEVGARLYKSRGCASCHTATGAASVGPSFKGVFGHEVVLSDRRRVPVDEDYLRESILEPTAKVVAGFDPVMPTYQGRIKDKEITAIIEYIKTLP
jgi:cytochrome c oxidase subunit II